MAPEVLTPHLRCLLTTHLPSSSPRDEDRSPLSRVLDPPPCAPLQHINGATGTNCPTLDVLESQIASAASRAVSPASTSAAANSNNVNNRAQTFKNKWLKTVDLAAQKPPVCFFVRLQTVKVLLWQRRSVRPPPPFDFGLCIQQCHWFRFSFFSKSPAPTQPAPPTPTYPANAPLLQMPSAAIFLANLQCRHNNLWYSAHV